MTSCSRVCSNSNSNSNNTKLTSTMNDDRHLIDDDVHKCSFYYTLEKCEKSRDIQPPSSVN